MRRISSGAIQPKERSHLYLQEMNLQMGDQLYLTFYKSILSKLISFLQVIFTVIKHLKTSYKNYEPAVII